MIYVCPKHQGFDPGNCPLCAEALLRMNKEKPVTVEQATHNSLRFKKMKEYTEDDLKFAIDDAIDHCKSPNRILMNARESRSSLDFWRICRGIDAFLEQRKRKEEESKPHNHNLKEIKR